MAGVAAAEATCVVFWLSWNITLVPATQVAKTPAQHTDVNVNQHVFSKQNKSHVLILKASHLK